LYEHGFRFTGHRGGGKGVYFHLAEILEKLEICTAIIDTGAGNRKV
jgi:hypothetical protein